MRAAKMFAEGRRQAEVVRRLGVSRQTASRWHKTWSAEGNAGLRAAGRAGRKSRLDQQARTRLALALLDGPRAWGFATELWTLERVGPERYKFVYQFKSMLSAGIKFGMGSDCPVERLSTIPRSSRAARSQLF